MMYSVLTTALLLWSASGCAAAQAAAPPDAFRIRIANSPDGPLQLSVDHGGTWKLIARVARPVTDTAPGGQPAGGTVLRSSSTGLAMNAGAGRIMRLLPDSPSNRRIRGAIVANVPQTAALFKDFLPPAGSRVGLISPGHTIADPLPPGYGPHEDDVLEITATESSLPADKIAAYADDAARYYRERAFARLRARGQKPASGTLTVTARLADGEEAGAVTFLLDGVVAGIMNRPPFTMSWDTRNWADGEHLLEVRALNKAGTVLSRRRTLVVVQNMPS